MPDSIPALSFVFSLIGLLIAFGVPIGLAIYCCRHHKGSLMAITTGAFCFIVGANFLEQLFHSLVFTAVPGLLQNAPLMIVYGCLAAGVFEESARLLGLRYLCKRDSAPAIGFAYGIGHGGIEAILLFGFTMINNLIVMTMVNSGNAAQLLTGLTSEAQAIAQSQLSALAELPATNFLAGGVERLFAISLHLALSMLVWMAVSRRIGMWGYPLAIGLHAFTDIPAMLYQTGLVSSIWLTELLVLVFTAVVVMVVLKLYRDHVKQPLFA